jgi:hypothetical protein
MTRWSSPRFVHGAGAAAQKVRGGYRGDTPGLSRAAVTLRRWSGLSRPPPR